MGWTIYNSKGEPLVTQEQHDHTIADASGPLTNDEHDGFSEYDEIAAPANPAANKLRLYPVDVGGVTGWALLDSAGAETTIVARTRRLPMTVFSINHDTGGSNNPIMRDADTNDGFRAGVPVPDDWVVGTDITVHCLLFQNATAGSPIASLASYIQVATDQEALGFNFENAAVANLGLTQNVMEEVSRTITGASVSAGDFIYWALQRNGTSGDDTVNGQVSIVGAIWMEYTAFF
ncbi:hypothetical protein LCGC14_2016130 [marine sediment metagenome]|uniref:Uncharacterized protein n=1 Tax=marine sediment metagenome TaxID=412755 RepID=A0A0F9EYY8_9ZZZZ